MNARRYPRTMDQAFGPYNRSSQCVIEPMQADHRKADTVLYIVGVICVVVAIVFNNYGA
jgi:hypothetical protein